MFLPETKWTEQYIQLYGHPLEEGDLEGHVLPDRAYADRACDRQGDLSLREGEVSQASQGEAKQNPARERFPRRFYFGGVSRARCSVSAANGALSAVAKAMAGLLTCPPKLQRRRVQTRDPVFL